MFQPGEEGYHGARFMIDDGLPDPLPDAAFALQIMPNAQHGTIGSRGAHCWLPRTCSRLRL
jgi:hippurate hydrolase